jgi:branched-chain amino acid aminotransferase
MAQWSRPEEAFQRLSSAHLPHWDNYLGFYSSWFGGYFREPWAMLIAMDDHGFHRGDGVFEAARLHQRAYIDLHEHLRRLQNSAAAIGMELPKSLEEIEQICVELARLCDVDSGILRLYVTRGPGSFSPSPNDVTGHQLYMAITKLKPPSAEQYARGVTAMISTVEAKEAFWSQIKSCNYLQNVLMKRECLARGVDFAISVDGEGRLCEGATENLLLVTADREIVVPKFDYTLRGTTVRVVMKLAERLVTSGQIRGVRLGDVRAADLFAAQEAAFIGTTLGVLPVREVDGRPIGGGKPGPICQNLQQFLLHEMATSGELRTTY